MLDAGLRGEGFIDRRLRIAVDYWDTGVIGKDGKGSLTFDTPGVFEYYCTDHPSMKATLSVR